MGLEIDVKRHEIITSSPFCLPDHKKVEQKLNIHRNERHYIK